MYCIKQLERGEVSEDTHMLVYAFAISRTRVVETHSGKRRGQLMEVFDRGLYQEVSGSGSCV